MRNDPPSRSLAAVALCLPLCSPIRPGQIGLRSVGDRTGQRFRLGFALELGVTRSLALAGGIARRKPDSVLPVDGPLPLMGAFLDAVSIVRSCRRRWSRWRGDRAGIRCVRSVHDAESDHRPGHSTDGAQPDGDRQNRGYIDGIHHPLALWLIASMPVALLLAILFLELAPCVAAVPSRLRPITSRPCGLDRSDRRRCVAAGAVVGFWFHY